MYFPILRGRQFELIALRELLEAKLISDKIIPIIEPVKLSSTLISTLSVFRTNDAKIALIRNPRVGEFQDDLKKEEKQKTHEKFIDEHQQQGCIGALYVDTSLEGHPALLESSPEDTIAILTDRDAIEVYESIYSDSKPLYSLIPFESGFKRRIRTEPVILEDKFKKRMRNTDYASKEDEPFSEDHLFYKEDGFVGFSDYSVVGDEYSESGFAPYAVAIHIVYFAEDESLRIHHFVSDTNEDITDPAGKFGEALAKLIHWNAEKKLATHAMKTFERLYDEQNYPGLGSVKKLSIMHHLELMSSFLSRAVK